MSVLNPILKEHILLAARNISEEDMQSWSQYYIHIDELKQDYPFKILIRRAYELATNKQVKPNFFQSSESSRNYIKNRFGYHIFFKTSKTEYSTILPFITIDEIEYFSQYSGKKYRKDNESDKNIGQNLQNSVYKKTNEWANLSTIEGFEMQPDNQWQISGNFKHYTWARIFKKGEKDKKIFFTVGIDIESEFQGLLFKLDCQRKSSKPENVLSTDQIELFDKIVSVDKNVRISISKEQLKEYDWNKLVNETKRFIQSHLHLYEEVIKAIWPNEKRIARLCWNTNGWVYPTGYDGKSTNKDSHEANFGYGHEEWLFDLGKLDKDGYHYGFLEPIRKQQNAYKGKTFDVWLYTIDGISKKRYHYGEIRNVIVIDEIEAQRVKEEYIQKGWFDEMVNQINKFVTVESGFSNFKGVELFNVKFRITDLYNNTYTELPKEHYIYQIPRYTFSHFQEDSSRTNQKQPTAFEFSPPTKPGTNSPSIFTRTTYDRQPKEIEISNLHRVISDSLTSHLRKIHGFKNVRTEHPAFNSNNRIDIVVNTKEGLIFYEIKTYASLQTSIREALGQILEYGYWPNVSNSKELIIVTQAHDNYDEAILYFKHLRDKLSIPIYFQAYDLVSETIIVRF